MLSYYYLRYYKEYLSNLMKILLIVEKILSNQSKVGLYACNTISLKWKVPIYFYKWFLTFF